MSNRNELYERIGQRILDSLNEGVVPWRKQWKGLQPRNLVSKRAYRGINTLLLGLTTFGSPYWLTFKQAKALGGHVKAGERGTQIVFWKFYKKMVEGESEEDAEERGFAVMRMYTVFNVEQTARIDESRIPAIRQNDDDPIEDAEAVIASWDGKPLINIAQGADRAFYSPREDKVSVPASAQFKNIGSYYQTLFHELAHSTGHSLRLGRFDDNSQPSKESYSKEELVAEISSAFICGILGIDYNIQNTESYVKSWVGFLKDKKSEVVRAASAAQKVVDMILGVE